MKDRNRHSKDYKKQTIFLLVVIVLLYVLSFRMAVKETFTIRDKGKDLISRIEKLEDAPRRIAYLEKSLDQLSNLLGQFYGQSTDIQRDILNDLTNYCQRNRLIIREVPSTHVVEKMGYRLETCQVIVEGRFIGLLKLLHHLETEFYAGQIISASFIRKTDLKTKRNYLLLKVFIQNIKLLQDEKK